jgi:AcrR family transcriptional regulator
MAEGKVPRIVDHDERRREIAILVEDLVAELGVEAVTIRDVAARAGFSTAVISHYFRTKQQMFLFTYAQARRRATERLLAASREDKDLVACLSELLPRTKRRLAEWHAWFGFWGMAVADPIIGRERLTGTTEARQLFTQLIREAQRRGEVDAGVEAERLATHLQIAINGLATLVTQAPDDWPAERQTAALRHHVELLAAARPRREGSTPRARRHRRSAAST